MIGPGSDKNTNTITNQTVEYSLLSSSISLSPLQAIWLRNVASYSDDFSFRGKAPYHSPSISIFHIYVLYVCMFSDLQQKESHSRPVLLFRTK